MIVNSAFSSGGESLFTRSVLAGSLRPPGIEYYIIVAAGLAASLAIIASSFPLPPRFCPLPERPARPDAAPSAWLLILRSQPAATGG